MILSRRSFLHGAVCLPLVSEIRGATQNWPSFRGPYGQGVADGFEVRSTWNVDRTAGPVSGVRWQSKVPGLGHSSPVIWGDRIFCSTAVAEAGDVPLKLGPGGQPTAADDNEIQGWMLICFSKSTGRELWRETAHRGKPRATRHAKATHANTSLATDGRHLVAFFGSEGLYCYDLDGREIWSRDLGVVNISKYGIGWGYASSPAIHHDRLALLCDDPDHPFIAVFQLSDGKELWRVSRKNDCERSWATPLIHPSGDGAQVVANGWPWIVSYDLETGGELWRLRGGGDNPTPTPFSANGLIYITNAHGGLSPIFAVRPRARGDISLPKGVSTTKSIVWSKQQGGSYMSTPVVYRGHIYFGGTNGVMRCFDSNTGREIYEKRLDPGAAIYSSMVAADGKILCASEKGIVYVFEAGPTFNLLAKNKMGEPCFGTPAISEGVIYFRTTGSLIAIG